MLFVFARPYFCRPPWRNQETVSLPNLETGVGRALTALDELIWSVGTPKKEKRGCIDVVPERVDRITWDAWWDSSEAISKAELPAPMIKTFVSLNG